MKPVLQTKFDAEGNCATACWASLLGVPIDYIPDLNVQQQFSAEAKFAARLGLAIYSVADVGSGSWDCPGDPQSDVVYMASGPGARGVSHRVLMRDGVMVHDPHVDQTGLEKVERLILVLGDVRDARRTLVAHGGVALEAP